jgi:hypothetical protein
MRRIRLVVAVLAALASVVVVVGGTPTAHAYEGVGGGQVTYRSHNIPGGCFGEPCARLSGWTFTGTLHAPATWTGTFTGNISIRHGAAVPVHISLMTETVVGDAVRAAWTTACRYPVPCNVPD